MDINREIEVLEDTGQTTSTRTNGFNIAPPQLCQRWASPDQIPPRISNVKATPSLSQWIHTRRPTNYQHQTVSPIITKVESLSPIKNPVINKVVSLSSLKNSIHTNPHRSLQRIHSGSTHSASNQVRVVHPKPSSFLSAAPNLSVNVVNNVSPRIKSVISLSPLKNQKGTNGTMDVTAQFHHQNYKGSREPQRQFECITIDEDEDNSDKDSKKPCGGSQDSCIIEEEPQKDCKKVLKIIEDMEKDCSDNNVSDVKGRWLIREDTNICSDVDESTATRRDNCDELATATSSLLYDEGQRNHTDETVTTVTTIKKRRITPIAVEMSPTIYDFIDLCNKIDKSDDMQTILEKKVLKHLKGCDPEFLESSSFKKLVRDEIEKVKEDQANVYVHISDFLTEIKARKLQASYDGDAPPPKKRKIDKTKTTIDYEELEDTRAKLKIRKLSRFLSKLEKKIKKLEAVEVDWDDDDDSAYIILQRYKARACKVFDKLCEYTKESKSAGKIIKIHFSGTQLQKVNKCIQNYINHTGKFPDFPEILDVIKQLNRDENLKLSEDKIQEIATDAFTKVGEELQLQRRHSVFESLSAFQVGDDPAQFDSELNSKLSENYENGEKRIQQVIDEFAVKEKEKKEKNTSENGAKEEEEEDDDDDDDEEEEEEDIDDDEPFDADQLSNLSSENESETAEVIDEESPDPLIEMNGQPTDSGALNPDQE